MSNKDRSRRRASDLVPPQALALLAALAACTGAEQLPATHLPSPQIISATRTETPNPLPGPLAFASYRAGESEIFQLNRMEEAPVRLTDVPERVSKPVWAPDGQSLAVVVTDSEFNLDIYLLELGSGDLVRLTDAPRVDTEPSWSPDGEQIAFSSDRDSYISVVGLIYEFEIYVMARDGSGQRNLTNSPGWDTAPSWSPDGQRIAFQSSRDENPEIYLMNADGSQPVNLTRNAAEDAGPAWSPDGSRIAFHSDRNGPFNIFVMDADGSQVRQLTDTPRWDIEPAWSPTGSHLAFHSNRTGNFELFLMRSDGSEELRLTVEPDFDGFPDWEP